MSSASSDALSSLIMHDGGDMYASCCLAFMGELAASEPSAVGSFTSQRVVSFSFGESELLSRILCSRQLSQFTDDPRGPYFTPCVSFW